MSSDINLGANLKAARTAANITQSEAATAAGVAREVISYWENNRRTPSLAQLQRLAQLLHIPVESLLSSKPDPDHDEHAILFRGLQRQGAKTRAGVGRWLQFLDDWANLREAAGDRLPGRALPPVVTWRAREPVTDSRRAPAFAESVRSFYDLGNGPVAVLPAFLDLNNVTVCRFPLDPLTRDSGVSGIFYNHPHLGYSILVNTETTPGRQMFTLAHEFAHALFHYQEQGLVSRAGDSDRKESFANTFAAHFLVPDESLRENIAKLPSRDVSTPFDVIQLHRTFNVSYALMLNRLVDERCINTDQHQKWMQLSPRDLAMKLGLPCAEYDLRTPAAGNLARFPVSVLQRVRQEIEDDLLSVSSAASLLGSSIEELQLDLLASPRNAKDEELEEFAELPKPVRAA
jgi:Zn-dependent peptidase ImmA (M78 family)/transcriptional regulator with XRE-family HTH domain